MYESPQKKNSSWTPSTVQKKGKSPSKLGHFSIQPKPHQSSESSQEIGEYSRTSMDRLAANVMRSLQTREQELAEESIQPKFQSPWAPTFEPPPPLPESPASKLKGAFASVSENPIQRQCSECAKEEEEQKGAEGKDLDEIGIQTKLTVGAPGDAYEQEADRVASQVMSMSAPPDSSASVQRQLDTNHPHHPHQIWQRAQSITPVVQRQIDPRVQMRQMIQRAHQIDGNQASGDLESRLNASKGGGSPLSENVRGFMEPRFGADFSGVRVHTGGEAVQMNQELGAQAFTHGSDVYFGAGKSPGNNELTAHELTHVVQQQAIPSTIQRMLPCPSRWTNPIPSGWQRYHGDSSVFHCGFRGILEERIPTPEDPQNECFYDLSGVLVDQNHPYAGCGGTPNQYDSDDSPIFHTVRDSGGILHAGAPAFITSRIYDVNQSISAAIRIAQTLIDPMLNALGEVIVTGILTGRAVVNPSNWSFNGLPLRTIRHLNVIGGILSSISWNQNLDRLLTQITRRLDSYPISDLIAEITEDINQALRSRNPNAQQMQTSDIGTLSLLQLVDWLHNQGLIQYARLPEQIATEEYDALQALTQ
jgi:hypothetical protein